jgi:hypothetical protein
MRPSSKASAVGDFWKGHNREAGMTFGALKFYVSVTMLWQLASVVAISPAIARDLCPAMIGKMPTSGALYAAKSGCPDSSCLDSVTVGLDGYAHLSRGVLDSRNLEQNVDYNFFYRATQTLISRSVVAVQLKLLPAEPRTQSERKQISGVTLTRDEIRFACTHANPYPASEAFEPWVATYKRYDRYHRAPGEAFNDDVKFLDDEYHIGYQANSKLTCASGGVKWTKVWGRRELFLLNDRGNFSTNVVSYYGRGLISNAYAGHDPETEQLPSFSQIRVHMTSYSKTPGEAGCFSFPIKTSSVTDGLKVKSVKEIDLVLRDIEELQLSVHDSDRYTPEIWKIPVSNN